jgi:predicted Zn-dependent protease
LQQFKFLCITVVQGKLVAAVEAYERALGSWAGQPVAAYSLANALLQLNRLREAATRTIALTLVAAIDYNSTSKGSLFHTQ